MLIVEPTEGSVFKARVMAWQKLGQKWQVVFPQMMAVVGRSGIAANGEKREGDGRTPLGVFLIKTAFGYAPTVDTKLSYRQSGIDDVWIDDVHSKNYNRWCNIKDLDGARSFERMKREDDLYKAGLVIEYNTAPVVAGLGSAIFLHIWRSFDKSTSGCVALSEKNVLKLLKWLDMSHNPVIVINSK